MNQGKNRMSDAMRRLNALAPQGAPAALGDRLKDEFLRHHATRRRTQAVRISLLAAGLAAVVAISVLVLRPRSTSTRALQENAYTSPQTKPTSLGLAEPLAPRPQVHKSAARVRTSPGASPSSPARTVKNAPGETDRFVALPTYDPAIPIGELQMVRLDLPGRALQLVGFPVPEDFAERRVIADVLLAQDGTPYALRLVRSTETKEQ
jgi:hypothetical protein